MDNVSFYLYCTCIYLLYINWLFLEYSIFFYWIAHQNERFYLSNDFFLVPKVKLFLSRLSSASIYLNIFIKSKLRKTAFITMGCSTSVRGGPSPPLRVPTMGGALSIIHCLHFPSSGNHTFYIALHCTDPN